MLTKTKLIAALLGTIGTAAVGGVANAQEFVPPPNGVTVAAPGVTVTAPSMTPVDYGYGYDRDGYYGRPGVYYRDGYRDGDDGWRHERWEHERREHERREWMRHRRGWGW